jgi:K(+)-stimulated pyrophosphate-energized sodium pump
MDYMWLALGGAIIGLAFAYYLAQKVLKFSEGTEQMVKIASAIRAGANAYLHRQYKGVAKFFAVMFVILIALSFAGFINFFVPFAFLTGGIFSGLAGFYGMKIATRANSRTAWAAKESLNSGLRVAFSAGADSGFWIFPCGTFS